MDTAVRISFIDLCSDPAVNTGHGSADSFIDLCSDPAVNTGNTTENISHFEIGTCDNSIDGQPDKGENKRIDENQDKGIMQISEGQSSQDQETPRDVVNIVEMCIEDQNKAARDNYSDNYQEPCGNEEHVTTSHSEESGKEQNHDDSDSLPNFSRGSFLV